MLVMLTEERVISTIAKVCQGCLLADRSGLPRWREGKLGCGHFLGKSDIDRPALYECQMGFRIANIE